MGNLDPNADWNTLSSSPAQIISGRPDLLHNLVLYPGDTIEVTLQNGTVYGPKPFGATYIDPGPTGPLETGGDFYNFFVLGLYPRGFYDEVIVPLLKDEDPQIPDRPLDSQDPSDWEPRFSSHVPLSSPSGGWSQVDPAWPSPNLQQASFGRNADAMITGMFQIRKMVELPLMRLALRISTSKYRSRIFEHPNVRSKRLRCQWFHKSHTEVSGGMREAGEKEARDRCPAQRRRINDPGCRYFQARRLFSWDHERLPLT
jgi:hypothetical protein